MKWIVDGEELDLLDEFTRTCRVFEMFRDETDTWLIPLPIKREIVLLNGLVLAGLLGGNMPMHIAKYDTSRLRDLLRAADYLDCDLKTDIAAELARRLAGKTPLEMAHLLDIEYIENAKLEYALRNYLVPSDAVTPWPSV